MFSSNNNQMSKKKHSKNLQIKRRSLVELNTKRKTCFPPKHLVLFRFKAHLCFSHVALKHLDLFDVIPAYIDTLDLKV